MLFRSVIHIVIVPHAQPLRSVSTDSPAHVCPSSPGLYTFNNHSPASQPTKRNMALPVTLITNPEADRHTQTPLPGPPPTSNRTEVETLTTTVLTKILVRLEALEKLSMPPPVRRADTQSLPREEDTSHGNNRHSTQNTQPREEPDEEFTHVTQKRKGRKGKEKTTPLQVNLTPASYAKAAASSANIKQPAAPPKGAVQLPSIMEVTVLRAGADGHTDPRMELGIRA